MIAAGGIPDAAQESKPRYALIGQMLSAPDKRDDLVTILAAATSSMSGCLSYIVALDEGIAWKVRQTKNSRLRAFNGGV